MNIKKHIRTLATAVSVLAVSCSAGEPFSKEVVLGEITRCPDAFHLDFKEGKQSWNYTTGLELKAFLDVADRYGDEAIFNYVENWFDKMIDDNGDIHGYKPEKYNIDHICPARALFRLYDVTGKEKYRLAIEKVKAQLDNQPRTPDGCFWHKLIYPQQVWLDGVYMAEPFYAEYVYRYYSDEDKPAGYADIADEFVKAANHTFDPATGLFRHAWDASYSMFWCNPVTGQSEHCWGRALGWLVMATVDVLEYLPEDTPGRSRMIENLRHIYQVLPLFADPETGLWYQVLDQPGREGNYLEATCNCMFAYGLLKGVRLGYLDKSLGEYAGKTYESVLKTFVSRDADGVVSLDQCCSVGGLGGGQMRKGDYEYYLSEPIRSNDAKGIGPLIWAALETER